MKKRIKYVIFIFFCMLFFNNVYALSVSNNNLTIERGMMENISLYANSEEEIKSVTFTLVYSTYDIPAAFAPASGFSDNNPNGITHTITFNEAKSGKILIGTITISVKSNPKDNGGTISIHSATATTTNGETKSLKAQNVNVTIGTSQEDKPQEEEKKEETVKDTNLLSKIESKLVNIELKKDVFEYTVTVDEDVTELDLKAVAKDEKTKVEIGTQKISELKDNKIVINTSNGNIKQAYTINVKVKEEEEIKIDNTKFKANTGYKGKWILLSIFMLLVLFGGIVLNRKSKY